ncbi:MAG: GNAT family N-acetyltransferase [Streptosporangiaceae bacterium]
MDIIEVADPGDDQIDAWHALVSAAHVHDHPGDPEPDAAQTVGWLLGGPRRRLWAVPAADGLAAVASLRLPGGFAPARPGEIDIHVHPARRRHGLGARLLALAAQGLREDGRTSAIAQAVAGTPAVPFLEANGFECVLTMRGMLLRNADVSAARLIALSSGPAGYRLIRWTGTVPDELAPALAQAKRAMADNPEGKSAWDADSVREMAEAVAKRGDDLYTVAALHGEVLVGFTEIVVPGGGGPRAAQYDTAVLPEHRGRRIGIWLKASMLGWIQSERPEVEEIETDNADDNAHMLAVNEELGFEPQREYREYQAAVRDLPSPT